MRDWMRRGDWIALGAGQAELGVATVCIAASLAISVYTIATRTLLIPTSEWVLNLPLELITLASLFGAGGLVAREGHIEVDFLVDWLPPTTGALARGAVSLLLGIVSLFLVTKGIGVTRQAMAIHLTIPEIFDLPVAFLNAVSTAAMVLWTLHFGWLAVRYWAGAFRLERSSPSDKAE